MKLILYSTDCPRCLVLEKKLQQKNLEFVVEKNVDAMIEKGFRSAPLLEVDGEILDFGKANKWIDSQE